MTVVTYGSGVDAGARGGREDGRDRGRGGRPARRSGRSTPTPCSTRVARTSRALVLQEASASIGVADALVSLIAREAFEPGRADLGGGRRPDTPIPYAPELEDAYLPSAAGSKPRWRSSLVTEPSAIIPAARHPTSPTMSRRSLFRCMLVHRLVEERIIALYRQGRIPGSVYTGRGQEAVGAGAGLGARGRRRRRAAEPRAVVPPGARRPGRARVPQLPGPLDRPDAGRDGNMHFGVPENGVFPLVSMLGDLVPVTVGAAWAFKRRRKPSVALTFFGDGAFNCGDTHEGLNLAGALNVPAVFIAQSNRVAYSTVRRRRCATRTSPSASRAATRSRARGSTAPTRSRCTAPARAAVGGAQRRGAAGHRGAVAPRHRRACRARRRAATWTAR